MTNEDFTVLPGTSEGIDRASARDREYFQRHPEETSYEREAFPDEWVLDRPDWLERGATVMVRVTKITQNFRIRRPTWIAFEKMNKA